MKVFYVIIISLLILLFPSGSNAQIVNPREAHEIAGNFLKSRTGYSPDSPELSSVIQDNNQDPAIYVFLLPVHGFILVAADKAAFPILAYSSRDNWPSGKLSDNVNIWLENYVSQITQIRYGQIKPDQKIKEAWEDPLQFFSGQYKNQRTIAPLVLSKWNQGVFYNDSCPAVSEGPGGHGWGGCVPVAMAQVLFCHRYPAHGTGYHSYTQNTIGTLSADFQNTNYHWEAMLYRPDRHSPSLAQLIFHCGVAVDAIYSSSGTGSEVDQTVVALTQYFNYSPDAEFHYKSEYTDSLWKEMIKANLELNRPLIYRGSMGWTGHAWVCDGYEGEEFFHFNWGWSGFANGYYYLNNLNPGNYNFTSSQGAVFNIYPADTLTPPMQTDTVLATSGSICNKRWPESDFADFSHQWLLLPSGSNTGYFQLMPEMMDLLPGDSILIYSGSETSGEPAGVFTSDSSPEVIHLTGTTAGIRSVNHSGTGKWALSYLAFKNNFCNLNSMPTDLNRYLYDGSGNFYMIPGTNCSWLISPGNTEIDSICSIEADFYKFLIGRRDTVIIYDGPTTNSPVLNILTGDSIPGHIHSSGDKLLIRFMTDTLSQTAEGIEVAYTSVLPEYCVADSIITASSGTISNGSNGHNYHNNTLCTWLIKPENAEGITFTFNSLNTEFNRDRIEFYSAGSYPEQLLKIVSGNEIPAPFTLNGASIRIIFRSDNSIVHKGWELSYQAKPLSVNHNPVGINKVYPVPVGDVLYVELPFALLNSEYSIRSSTGYLIGQGKTDTGNQLMINTSMLKPGIYFLSVTNKETHQTFRFVKG